MSCDTMMEPEARSEDCAGLAELQPHDADDGLVDDGDELRGQQPCGRGGCTSAMGQEAQPSQPNRQTPHTPPPHPSLPIPLSIPLLLSPLVRPIHRCPQGRARLHLRVLARAPLRGADDARSSHHSSAHHRRRLAALRCPHPLPLPPRRRRGGAVHTLLLRSTCRPPVWRACRACVWVPCAVWWTWRVGVATCPPSCPRSTTCPPRWWTLAHPTSSAGASSSTCAVTACANSCKSSAQTSPTSPPVPPTLALTRHSPHQLRLTAARGRPATPHLTLSPPLRAVLRAGDRCELITHFPCIFPDSFCHRPPTPPPPYRCPLPLTPHIPTQLTLAPPTPPPPPSSPACPAAPSSWGLHPDGATEAIVDCALQLRKPFAIVPCCVFPDHFRDRRLKGGEEGAATTGRRVRSYDEFIEYLQAKDPRIRLDRLPFQGRNIVLYMDAL